MNKIIYVMMLAVTLLFVLAADSAEEPKKETPKETAQQETKETTAQTPPQVPAKPTLIFSGDSEKLSYIVGTQVAKNFQGKGVQISTDMLVRGISDVMEGKELALGPAEMQQVLTGLRERMAKTQRQQAEENLAQGQAFLEQNKKDPEVKVLPSGMQYKIIQEGAGRTPTLNDRVKTNYRGALIDGTEFDSSYQRNQPAVFPVRGVIAGWTEALQLMKEGAKWKLFIPADLAYGSQGNQRIAPNSTLVFEIELIEVMP